MFSLQDILHKASGTLSYNPQIIRLCFARKTVKLSGCPARCLLPTEVHRRHHCRRLWQHSHCPSHQRQRNRRIQRWSDYQWLNKTTAMKQIASKFVQWDVPELEKLKDSKVYKLRERLDNGGKLSRSEKNWLTRSLQECCHFKCGIAWWGIVLIFRMSSNAIS